MGTERARLFSQYNKVKAAAKRNKAVSSHFDPKRIDRALGLLMRSSQEMSKYHTTIGHCECPDQFYRPQHVCKHRLALILLRRVEQNGNQA